MEEPEFYDTVEEFTETITEDYEEIVEIEENTIEDEQPVDDEANRYNRTDVASSPATTNYCHN